MDHRTRTFISWLRIIEERFNLPPLIARDKNKDDMLDCFHFKPKHRRPMVLSAPRDGSPDPHPRQTIEP